jgi:hypothetical protein
MAIAQFAKTNSHNCAQMTRILRKQARLVHSEGLRKSPRPVILSEAKNLHLFVLKVKDTDSSLRSE